MQIVNTDYVYKNDPDRACFQHDMTFGKYKDLNKRTSNSKYEFQRGLASIFWACFDNVSTGRGIKSMPNQKLVNELDKQNIRKFRKRSLFFV